MIYIWHYCIKLGVLYNCPTLLGYVHACGGYSVLKFRIFTVVVFKLFVCPFIHELVSNTRSVLSGLFECLLGEGSPKLPDIFYWPCA